ncbi:MAG: putative sensor domain DACNV-containing protein [Leptolyngbya sp. BL-A-14]
MLDENFQLLGEMLKVRFEIASEFGSNQTCGSKEFAIAIQKINAIKPFLRLSEKGLNNLIDLAFKVSLQKEEARYPRFQIYIPSDYFLPIDSDKREPDWLIRFDPTITLDVSTLHRMSSGMLSRPYALFVEESEENIEAYGVIRIENLSSQNSLTASHINMYLYPGLIISIEEPGILNVSLSNTSRTILENLTLRHGKIERIYDPYVTPIIDSFYKDIEKDIRNSRQVELSSNISSYIGSVWSYVLSLAVDFRHGGQFIILPSGYLLNEDNCLSVENSKVLQIKHTTTEPDLGAQISSLDQASIQQKKPSRVNYSLNDKKIPEDNCDSAFKNGVSQGLSMAKRIHDKYQTLFDSAKAAATLSTTDGCLVFDRGLRLLGFKGEVLVREDPKEYIELDLDFMSFKQKGIFDIGKFGTRHRSAARFCGKIPGAVVFVVSQDGDIRLFMHIEDGKVGIGGPLRPLPGSTPSIVHS